MHLALLGWPEGALLVAHVLRAVEDDGVLLLESYGRHLWECGEEEEGGAVWEKLGGGGGEYIGGYMFFGRTAGGGRTHVGRLCLMRAADSLRLVVFLFFICKGSTKKIYLN